MDTFCEQLIPVRKDTKTKITYLGIWILAIIISLTLILFMVLGGLSLLVAFAVIFGAYWLTSKLNVEFEYIITNGSMDIDKITNKSSRKRALTFDLKNVTRLEKYNPAAIHGINTKKIVFACNTDMEGVYFMAASRDTKDTAYLVFAPEDKIKSAINKFAPKFITNGVFE